MIRFLLVSLLSFSCLWAKGELVESPYKFSVNTGTYQPLGPASKISSKQEFFELQLPFGFSFFDSASRSVTISQTGSLDFAGGWMHAFEGNFKPATSGNSGIFYSVSGSAPRRILKIEWRNFTAYELPESCCKVNFQVWLMEADCSIEIHFGNTTIDPKYFDEVFGPGATGPWLGLFQNSGPGVLLSGPAENPNIHSTGFHMLQQLPEKGSIYRFRPEGGRSSASKSPYKKQRLRSAQVFIGTGRPSYFENLL